MSCVFMVIHYPAPGRREALLRAMAERAELLAAAPGCVEVGAWQERGDRLVGISRWESEAAFRAAVPPGFGEPSDEIPEGETRPREKFLLFPG
ncbi:antibiotic biosynthesis monooxygenase [Micromonospora sp. NPDC049559]|uniref:putative quinol monooxygenase n=1 Tax=Micromonospora sp. NPDC049559 TaxID=3155923 RepID=UPI003424235E